MIKWLWIMNIQVRGSGRSSSGLRFSEQTMKDVRIGGLQFEIQTRTHYDMKHTSSQYLTDRSRRK
jgi:hypothetical protein